MPIPTDSASVVATDLTTEIPANLLTKTAFSDISERSQSSLITEGADFDRDGQLDLIWRNTATGDNAIWLMRGTQVWAEVSLLSVPDLNWQIAGTGDFNRDGQTDIVWRNDRTGENGIWYMNGSTLASSVTSSTVANQSWQIAAVTDFNHDGYSDLVWRNYSTGANVIWYMQGATLLSSAALTSVADTTWQINGTGDFNHDGQTDLIWRNYRTGENSLWLMNETAISTTTLLATVSDANWQIEGSGDFNGDGWADLVWRNYSTGQNDIWYMDGTTRIGNEGLAAIADSNWQIGTTSTRLLAFSSTFGYGLVDAAAALSRALGRTPLASTTTYTDVANLGGNLGYLDQIHAPEAWAKGYTGQGITVAVIDSGVNYYHPDLIDNIWSNPREIAFNSKDDDGNGLVDDTRGWDFYLNDNIPFDIDGHGSQVAGLIAGENNRRGALGVAYDAKIMPLRVTYRSATNSVVADAHSVASAIYYAVNNGARVINYSYGGFFPFAEETAAIQYAVDRGVVVVAAAGNNADPQPLYPARLGLPGLIAVGSVDRTNRLSYFSNTAGATQLDYLIAPGENVYTTNKDYDTFTTVSGTSFAAPLISGVAALILSARPDLGAENVVALLKSSAQYTGITS